MTHRGWKAVGAFAAIFLALAGCVQEYPNQLKPNAPPRTFFWLSPDSTIAEGISQQHLRWWGEDQDGYVIGYLLATSPDLAVIPTPDTLTYTYVTATDSILQFPLRQSRQNFLVVVRSVDNTFKGGLAPGARVRLTPEPYQDQNGNGVRDASEPLIAGLVGSYDAAGARQVFPTKNSPPEVNYMTDPADPTVTIQQPETTFTVATFSWTSADPDGESTIASYRIALNDTSTASWRTLPASVTTVTLSVPRTRSDGAATVVDADMYSGVSPNLFFLGTIPGLRLNARNELFVQARDVAGDYSPSTKFPRGTRPWFVKKPKSKLLVILDYQKPDSSEVRRFYRTAIAAVAGGAFADYDELDIRVGGSATRLGTLVPPIQQLNPAFTQTLRLFDAVIWYTDQTPSLTVAQYGLSDYWTSSSGGKVLYTTEFASATDPSGALRDFAPIDSISSMTIPPLSYPSLVDRLIPKNYQLRPDSTDARGPFPLLVTDSLNALRQPVNFHFVNLRPVYKRADTRVIYQLQPDARVPIRYMGTPALGLIDNTRRFVFLGIPLHILDGRTSGGSGVSAFLERVLIQEFGLQ